MSLPIQSTLFSHSSIHKSKILTCSKTTSSCMPILSRARLFPNVAPEFTQTPLSILDAAVVRFAPTAGVWLYAAALPTDQLTRSLKATMNSYPQWSGQLQWTACNSGGGHTQRYRRLMVVYGAPTDPGIDFIIASSSLELSSLVSAPVDGCLDVTDFPSAEFLDKTAVLAMHDAEEYAGLPCMIVQITTLTCGGIAIAIKLAHPLADAQSLLQFAHDWATVTRAMSTGGPIPALSPVFDPSLLDNAAAGDIDALHPNLHLVEVARALPMHHYDLWASTSGCPPFLAPATVVPHELGPDDVGPLGSPVPWENWDFSAPVSHYLVDFTAEEVHAMWEEANDPGISHLDALSAHIWSLIVRARGLEGEHHLDVTFGVRSRLQPPLPPSLLGSPLTLTSVTTTGNTSDHSLGDLAKSIRSSLKAFDPHALSALLHAMAFEASPQRHWVAFFGSRNTIVTSWLQLGVRDVDFGVGIPAYVEAVMPSVDGCVQVMEGGGRGSECRGSGRWYHGTVTVSLHLQTDVMQKVLEDPALRMYRK
ncbi:putative transferase family protein [Lyophyllum shimeji]|uniref:Transferase family protein n=1 Tax=Lyophyllum shimeji TaxID=47721 RepID=A0A9P3PTK0_LYOSH|nr:putative transferase family protein [Lyophyllum shimeji]